MAKLDAEERKELPKSDFGMPSERKYPMENASHASDAKARARDMLKRGSISEAEYNKICAKADRVLGEKPGAMKADPPAKAAPKADSDGGDMSQGADGASVDQFYKGK